MRFGNRWPDRVSSVLNPDRPWTSRRIRRYGVNAMPATPTDLFTFLDGLGIAHTTVTHPPLFTVEQARALRGRIPGGHTKNLFLKDKKDALFLVVAPEDAAIALKSLHRRLDAGSVTPFAALNDTAARASVILDAAMMEHATLNFHPLVNTMTTSIARGDLVRFLEATGHTPRIAAVGERSPEPSQ